MPRFRTLTDTYSYLKKLDAETAITPNALRRMVISGNIPCMRMGRKYLIDIDVLFESLKVTRPEDVLPGYKNPLQIVPNNRKIKRA
jgi:hypothetical protein